MLASGKLTKDERSILLYAESCIVDGSGLLEGIRMNDDDIIALRMFKEEGILDFGRIPAKLLGKSNASKQWTHWVSFTPEAWELASKLRQLRAQQLVPYGQKVFAEVAARKLEKA